MATPGALKHDNHNDLLGRNDPHLADLAGAAHSVSIVFCKVKVVTTDSVDCACRFTGRGAHGHCGAATTKIAEQVTHAQSCREFGSFDDRPE